MKNMSKKTLNLTVQSGFMTPLPNDCCALLQGRQTLINKDISRVLPVKGPDWGPESKCILYLEDQFKCLVAS